MSSARVNTQGYSRSSFTYDKGVKKFCGVCKNAGLPESDYTSHFTKSVPGPKGIVTCPTILANECSICYEHGHFRSACPKLAEKVKIDKRAIVQDKPLQKKPAQPVIPVNRGRFSALSNADSDSDSETVDRTIGKKRKVEEPVKEAWPLLSSSVTTQAKVDKPTFASIIAAPAPVKKVDTSKPNICGFTVLTKASDLLKTAAAPVYYERNEAEKAAYAKLKKSWADSDSEDEDEDW
jgi:hypothetical protein